VNGSFTGRALLTEKDGDFSERTAGQLELSADFGKGRYRPGVSLRLPLDDRLENDVNATYGVTFHARL